MFAANIVTNRYLVLIILSSSQIYQNTILDVMPGFGIVKQIFSSGLSSLYILGLSMMNLLHGEGSEEKKRKNKHCNKIFFS